MALRTIPHDRPIDPITIEILKEVATVAGRRGIDHLVTANLH